MGIKILKFLLAAIILFGCFGDKLNLPTTTNIGFKVADKSSEFLDFTGGNVLVSEIGLKGERKKGSSIQFLNNFENAKKFEFSDQAGTNFTFEIPQGDYSTISLYLKFEKGSKDEESSPVTLQFNGQYKTISGQNIPLQVDFKTSTRLTKRACNIKKDTNIVLYARETTQVDILLNPYKAFETTNRSALEIAKRTTVNNTELILIDEKTNADIYKELVKKLDSSVEVIFNLAE